MHKFIITALLLLLILMSAASTNLAISGGFSTNFQTTLIELAVICGIIAFASAFLFHLLMTFLKYKNMLRYDTLKAHIISGAALGGVIALAVGLLSFGTRWQKGEGVSLLDFSFFLFYPLLGLLTGLIYKLVKD